MEIQVTEDPVTGVWRFQLDGHQVEVEARLGFVKVDGRVHRVAAVEGLAEVEDLQGAPIDAIARLVRGTSAEDRPAPPAKATPVEPPAAEAREKQRATSRARRRRQAPAKPSKPVGADGDGALPTPEAAQYLGLRPATLETMRTRGGGPPFVKLGRRVVYRREDLDAWLAARVRKSTSDPGSRPK